MYLICTKRMVWCEFRRNRAISIEGVRRGTIAATAETSAGFDRFLVRLATTVENEVLVFWHLLPRKLMFVAFSLGFQNRYQRFFGVGVGHRLRKGGYEGMRTTVGRHFQLGKMGSARWRRMGRSGVIIVIEVAFVITVCKNGPWPLRSVGFVGGWAVVVVDFAGFPSTVKTVGRILSDAITLRKSTSTSERSFFDL